MGKDKTGVSLNPVNRNVIISIFVLLYSTCWVQSLFSKTPARLKISVNSKTDQPLQALVRGNNFEKNINFFEIKETIIDLPDQGNYEVILIWKMDYPRKNRLTLFKKILASNSVLILIFLQILSM
ncbi:hypothetical protein LEP1GSC059_3005 [Leptospira noguchii serovar Panama str. CZ214]|uniref:Uncharacterized protein n=1 Tax=Leptospira noguchii serovar Panama str. CZ214 TaxID=1001595 RepID=T0FN29_9LEPT|nr:hypothetical protein LEP1GSC059_3005 [Leptospira noguchii serovar Panama str. CZ214]